MRISLRAVMALMVFIMAGCSGKEEHLVVGETDAEFSANTCGRLAYRKQRINVREDVTPILVVYLHGGSSKGDDNELQMKELAVGVISSYLQDKQISSVFVVPQCPSTDNWGAKMNEDLSALIDECGSGCDGVYVLGGSMGGTGTWSLANAFPSKIRGIMPVAGKPGMASAQNFKSMRVCAVMSEADEVMKTAYVDVKAFCEKIVAAGGDAECTIVPASQQWTHQMTCEQSYTELRLDRLFGK